MKAVFTRRIAGVVAIGLISTIIGVSVVDQVGWLTNLDLRSEQLLVGKLSQNHPSSAIVLIVIDEQTQRKLSGNELVPVSRKYYVDILQGLKKANAKNVAFDIYFNEGSVKKDDDALRQAISDMAPMRIALGAAFDRERAKEDLANGQIGLWFKLPHVAPFMEDDNHVIASLQSPRVEGIIHGVRARVLDLDTKEYYPYLGVAAAYQYLGIPVDSSMISKDQRDLLVGSKKIPLDADEFLQIRWVGEDDRFVSVPFELALKELKEGKFNRYRGKLILIGGRFEHEDLHDTPLGELHGLDICANVVNTIIENPKPIGRSSNLFAILAILPFVLLAGIAGRSLKPLAIVFLGFGSILASLAVPVGSIAIFATWLSPLMAGIATMLGLASASAVSGISQAVLARKYTPEFARVRRKHDQVEYATVLFADLKDSTPLVNQLGPDRSRIALKSLLESMSAIVAEHGGDIENMAGDGVTAFFRSEKGRDHAMRAFRCVQNLQQNVAGKPLKDCPDYLVQLTYGIETGEISGGVVRQGERESWSSYGATIHLAARLQSTCRLLNVLSIVGPGFQQELDHEIQISDLGEHNFKGFEKSVSVYTIDASILNKQ